MKICNINEVVDKNFDAIFLNSLKQTWQNTKSFQCFGAPKKYNLFLFVNGYEITYTDINNNTFVAHSGDVVYTPVGSEYKVEISGGSPDSYTIGINFLLYDECNNPLTFGKDILIFHPSDDTVSAFFHQTLSYDIVKPFIRNKILLFEIICALASCNVNKIIPKRIITCIEHLSKHINEPTSIKSLADLCGVSEVYLRKEFKIHTGMSPVKYRNLLRLSKARAYIEYWDISVQEISDTLGYSTVSHFIKEFRSHFGMSPLQYKKQIAHQQYHY